VIVLNNNGYLSIRQSQRNFFGRLVGADPSSGVTFPDTIAVGAAYGLPSVRATAANCRETIRAILAQEGPAVCEIMLDPDQVFEPRLAARRLPTGEIVSPALHDMWPHLPPEELAENMPDWGNTPR
jgi:acetolactate synthase-1/2/3 large subunit